jgi:hypothetical protein
MDIGKERNFMSTFAVKVETISDVQKHPNADLLEKIRINGWWVIVPKGKYKVNDPIIYFPPNSLVPREWTDKWEITKYCGTLPSGHVMADTHVRIMAANIRAEPSFGFAIHIEAGDKVGDDKTKYYNAYNYETAGYDSNVYIVNQYGTFTNYTGIENYRNYPGAFSGGETIYITEKIHGTNFRAGYVKNPKGKFEFVAGSHTTQLKIVREFSVKFKKKTLFKYHTNIFNNCWKSKIINSLYNNVPYFNTIFNIAETPYVDLYLLPILDSRVKDLLYNLRNNNRGFAESISQGHGGSGGDDIVLYGEIYGNGVQDMNYGCTAKEYKFFDITINGKYQHIDILESYTKAFNLPCVKCLYKGPYYEGVLEEYVDGPTTLVHHSMLNKNQFKGREGIVVRSLENDLYEHIDPVTNKTHLMRKIFKLISVFYIIRSGEQTESH